MATLNAHSPGQRVEVGNAIVQASSKVNTKPIQRQLQRFVTAHRKIVTSQKVVDAADAKLHAGQQKVAENDVTQDGAVEDFAVARTSDGAKRSQPFADIKFAAPSTIQNMGYEDEANVCLKLTAAARKTKSCSKATAAKADALDRAARAVLAAIKPMSALEQVRTNAISARSALEQEWETAFAALKRATLAAEDDGARGLFAALFQRTARKPSRPAKKKPAAPAKPQGT